MKTRILILVFLIITVLIITGGAPKKTALPTDNIDAFVGTWANPANNKSKSGHSFGKMVFKSDKTIDCYPNADSKIPNHPMSLDVKEKWMDREDSYYIRSLLNHPYGQSFGMFIISSDGNILEMMFVFYPSEISPKELPSEIDPTADFYPVFYYVWDRQ